MARQSGHLFITGTLDDVTYYKMYGIYYARMKSSLSRKKVLTSPRFALTRMHASQLAEASKIASRLYREIPKEKKNMQLFRAFVGEAKVLLAQGKDKEEVYQLLLCDINPKAKTIVPVRRIKRKKELRLFLNKEGRLVLESLGEALVNGQWSMVKSERSKVKEVDSEKCIVKEKAIYMNTILTLN